MTRYPSSADLAALRYAFHEAGPDHDPAPDGGPSPYCPVDGPRTPFPDYWPTGGAWPNELADGIGTVPGRWPAAGAMYAEARREAAAMRSRAYDALLEAAAGDLAWADSAAKYRDVLDSYALDTFAPRRR